MTLDNINVTISEDGINAAVSEDTINVGVGSMGVLYHNNLSGKQGGVDPDEFYHLSAAELASFGILVGSGDTALHYHSADRARANHTGTQLLGTISDAGTMAAEDANDYLPKTGGGITGVVSINTRSTSAFKVEDVGEKPNVLVVDTINGYVTMPLLGVGANPLDGDTPVNLSLTLTSSVASRHSSLQGLAFVEAGQNSAGSYYGTYYESRTQDEYNYTSGSALVGGGYVVRHTKVGTVTGARAAELWIVNSGGGVITKGTSLRILPPTISGGSSITSLYGIYITNQSGATSENYAIYTNVGENRFGDQVSIIGSQNVVQQIVQAYASQTSPLISFRNSSDVAQMEIASNARDFILDTAVGTKIGTATGQKLAFYGATPIVKQVGVGVDAASVHAALVSLGLIAA